MVNNLEAVNLVHLENNGSWKYNVAEEVMGNTESEYILKTDLKGR